MRISYRWLRDYLQGEVPPAEVVAEKLTMAGLEVESLERPGAALEGVVVGEIRAAEPHPDAERLTVCRVYDGKAEHVVVCGAPNVRVGMRSAFAPPGVRLPGGLLIAERAVRGVASSGMLCAPDELGLSEDHAGIIDLGDAVPGAPVTSALGLDDVVLEVAPTPNRPDALSHVGVARDLCALLGLRLVLPEVALAEAGPPVEEAASVHIEDPERCPRYVARVIEGVRIGPSPDWLVARLRAAGVRSISNVVDVTNYVLMELGHPLHAFDLDRVGGRRIVVRRAGEGEVLRTLDGVERRMVADDLVIADGEAPVALAGVMGGGDSEVGEGTTRILLESAYFEPRGIRRTGRRHGLHTESSHRFERGADPGIPRYAADRAAALIAELAGGTVRPGALDVWPQVVAAPEVTLRWQRTDALLGCEIPPATQRGILERLGFTVVAEEPGAARFRAPSFRTEMDREIDLIEEVARIHGYEHIPATFPRRPATETGSVPAARSPEVGGRIRQAASAAGCHEVVNYSFLAPGDLAALANGRAIPEADPILVANPLSAEQSAMRTAVLPSLLGNLRTNRRWRETDLALYELGRAYLRAGEREVREPVRFGAVLSGRRHPRSWTTPDAPVDFYDAKGLVETILSALRIEDARFEHAEGAVPWLHPRSAAWVRIGGEAAGWVGELHPKVAEAFDLPAGIFALELEVEVLGRRAVLVPEHRGVPRFPAVLRDLAVVVPTAVPAAQVTGLLSEPLPEAEALGARVEEVTLFDVYEGAQVGEGRKSLAYAIRYQAPDRTLTDDEAGRLHEALLQRLSQALGASLRT